ncbi:MAG: hypothetical protein INH41_17325 [Myxococcaceae bacterium]|nr:hypothetical protein [Myxococcaceae bacterium]MCA3014145.1 hypothetical protein [Myxococcaceae bacterium]
MSPSLALRLAPPLLLAWSACAPRRVAPPVVTGLTIAELQQVVAKGPLPDDPCQTAWFSAVADTRAAAEALDALVAAAPDCPVPVARVRLASLARADTLSWGAESRAPDAATRLHLARFAAQSRWEPGTSAVADLVLDPDPQVRLSAVAAVRALRLVIAAGALERSLATTPARPPDEKALLCTALAELGVDPPRACGGLKPVAVVPVEPPDRPAPNRCRALVTSLASPDATVQRRALLELTRPWVDVRLGCAVANEPLLRLVQQSPDAAVRAAAATLLAWKLHPPDMRRAPSWPSTLVEPEAVEAAPSSAR